MIVRMTPDGLRPRAAADALDASLRDVLESTMADGEMIRVGADGAIEWFAVASRSIELALAGMD